MSYIQDENISVTPKSKCIIIVSFNFVGHAALIAPKGGSIKSAQQSSCFSFHFPLFRCVVFFSFFFWGGGGGSI